MLRQVKFKYRSCDREIAPTIYVLGVALGSSLLHEEALAPAMEKAIGGFF